ncbi:MAG: sensor histidine kinase, partial [Brevibacterium aurantiacum]
APAPPADALLAITLVTIASAVIGLGISLGVGALLRRTKRMKAVETIAARETQRNDSLSAELARQSERELLARELHDTLSHRLSVISLHSGALEVGSKDDADVASTASALRHEAHASLEDLRHLVGGVREGTLTNPGPHKEASTPPSQASMRSIPQLVASVQSTGTIIRPSIVIQDVESASTVLDRAVYRIVQESLTNAMKHAPGAPVTLEVTVSADMGAHVVIANPMPPSTNHFQPPANSLAEAAPGIPPYPTSAPLVGSSHSTGQWNLSLTGSGAGLEGIRERVTMLEGEVFIGVREGSFVVDAKLPPFAHRS